MSLDSENSLGVKSHETLNLVLILSAREKGIVKLEAEEGHYPIVTLKAYQMLWRTDTNVLRVKAFWGNQLGSYCSN